MPSYRQVHPTANNGSAEVMGRQARDRPFLASYQASDSGIFCGGL
ncbi:MAG: hypothetical protein ACKPB4_01560 [Sphaerospermopsis kisseleviana]